MMYEEFPHEVDVLQLIETQTDGNGEEMYDELGNPIYVEDELGNNISDNWQPLYTAFACYVNTPKANERHVAMQLNHKLDRKMYYPHGTDIAQGMRIVHDGVTYEVTKQSENLSGMNEIMRVYLSEVDV